MRKRNISLKWIKIYDKIDAFKCSCCVVLILRYWIIEIKTTFFTFRSTVFYENFLPTISVITLMTLRQLMLIHLGTWCTFLNHWEYLLHTLKEESTFGMCMTIFMLILFCINHFNKKLILWKVTDILFTGCSFSVNC